MKAPVHIQKAIAEVTGVRAEDIGTVWVYGEILWAKLGSFAFEAERPASRLKPKAVNLIPGQVTRYRDGGTSMFLIEMPRAMAKVLDIEEYVLTPEELKRKMERIDTSMPF